MALATTLLKDFFNKLGSVIRSQRARGGRERVSANETY